MLQNLKRGGKSYTKNMGMFDTIEDKLFCPFCGAKCSEFQSKDTGQNLTHWTIKEIETYFERKVTIEIHDICRNCKKFISINLSGSFKDEFQKIIGEKLMKIKRKNK